MTYEILKQYELAFEEAKGKSCKVAGYPNKDYHSYAFMMWLVKEHDDLLKELAGVMKETRLVKKSLEKSQKRNEELGDVITELKADIEKAGGKDG